MKQPKDLRPKRFTRKDGGDSVQYYLPMDELKTSSSYWLKRFKPSSVLVLSGTNPSLKVDNDYLEVTHGCTLTDLSPSPVKYARGVHGLSWIVIDSSNGFITVDALHWLDSQHIGLMVCAGKDSLMLQHVNKPIVSLRRKQYAADPVTVARWVLQGKLMACVEAVDELRNTPEFFAVVNGGLEHVQTVNDLRLFEGRAAGVYWKSQAFTLKHFAKWPEWWTEFNQRSSVISGGNRHATHPINAVLNYGYAIVATMIKRQCVLVGLDTAVGSLHADSNRRDSLVYDLLELVRADIDKNLLSWTKSVKWRRTDFKVSERGVVSLDANLKRVIGTRLVIFKPLVETAVKKYVLFMLKL